LPYSWILLQLRFDSLQGRWFVENQARKQVSLRSATRRDGVGESACLTRICLQPPVPVGGQELDTMDPLPERGRLRRSGKDFAPRFVPGGALAVHRVRWHVSF
jgi:hypothetical protein